MTITEVTCRCDAVIRVQTPPNRTVYAIDPSGSEWDSMLGDEIEVRRVTCPSGKTHLVVLWDRSYNWRGKSPVTFGDQA